jgi:hypothetical protein
VGELDPAASRRLPRKSLLAAIAGVVAAPLSAFAATARAATGAPSYAWCNGDERACVGRVNGTNDLTVSALDDVNLLGDHIRIQGRDGNFEFENQSGRSRFLAYLIGTSKRTPIAIGADEGADIVQLVVAGTRSQQSDLQQWTQAGKTVAAVDAHGGLRLGNVTLTTRTYAGVVELVAVLPDGSTHVLATSRAERPG